MTSRRFFLTLAVSALVGAASFLAVVGEAAAKSPPVYTGVVKGVGVGGYDAVAYFTDAKPVKGNPAITHDHEGVQYYFASEANRDAFKAEPAKYAPQFGGYCAWAVSQGYTAHGDPNAWTVSNGKLFLNYNQSVKKGWEKDIPGNVAKGEANWPKVLDK